MLLQYVVLVVSLLSWIAAAALVNENRKGKNEAEKSMRAYAGAVLALNLLVFLWAGFVVVKKHGDKLKKMVPGKYSPSKAYPFDF